MAEQRLIDANQLQFLPERFRNYKNVACGRGEGKAVQAMQLGLLAKVQEKIDNAPTIDVASRWIPVEESLPGSDCDWVLAIGKFVPENTYGKPIISELRKDGKWWGDINDEFPLEDMGIRITHWMPLPEPPKEE